MNNLWISLLASHDTGIKGLRWTLAWVVRPRLVVFRGLTFEVRRDRRQATRSGEYQGRGAWPAVGPRLDRVVRRR